MDEKRSQGLAIIKGFFTRNLGMKLLAVAFSLVVWAVVMVETNPYRVKMVQGVEVLLQNEMSLRDAGLVLRQDTKPKVDVYLDVRQNEVAAVGDRTVSVVADLSRITTAGDKIRLLLEVTTSVGTVRSVTPQYLEVNVDTWDSAEVPVTVNMIGKATQGFWSGKGSADPPTIIVEGPKNELAALRQVGVTVDLTNHSESVDSMMPIIFVGSDGKEMPSTQLRTSQGTVHVQIPIYPFMKVQIRDTQDSNNPYPISLHGIPAEGYAVAGVEVYPNQLTIAGPQELLNELSNGISTEPVDITGMSGSVRMPVKPVIPQGLQWIDLQTSVSAQVTFEEEVVERDFVIHGLEIRGQSEDYHYQASRTDARITMAHTKKAMAGLITNDFRIFVDVTGLNLGKHTLPIRVEDVTGAQLMQVTPETVEVVVTGLGGY